MRLASCLWANHRLDICPSEKWGESRVTLSLRHHVNKCLVFALLQDRFVPELVTATGSGLLGGFTLFQVRSRTPNPVSLPFGSRYITSIYPSTWKRDLPTRTKRKLHAIGGARGLWSLLVRTAVKVNGVPYDRPANPYQAENDSLILGTDAIPSPGFSRVRLSPFSFSADIDLTWMRGSSEHVHPRATLRSQLASRASLLVPHRSSKALRSYMCYQTPSEYSSQVGYISLEPPDYGELISSVRQMARSGK